MCFGYSRKISWYVLTGVTFVVGNIQREKHDGPSGENKAKEHDEFGSPGIIVIIRMLVIHEQIQCHNQKNDYGRQNGKHEK